LTVAGTSRISQETLRNVSMSSFWEIYTAYRICKNQFC